MVNSNNVIKDANGVPLKIGDKIRTERGALLRIDDSDTGPQVVSMVSPKESKIPLSDLKTKYYIHKELDTPLQHVRV